MEKVGLTEVTTINKHFWAGKRVLVTGHTGFKGSWLALWLQSMDAKVFGLALPPATKPALFSEARVDDNMVSIMGDIRNYEAVQSAMLKAQPEIVIHMAAQPLVRYSYKQPIETYATNVMGTVHVLEAARKISTVKAVINVTTDKCYENKEWVWGYREDEPMGGCDPYSSSKGCSELVTDAYRRSFFENEGIYVATARAGNVIGGGDWSTDRLIPDILRALERDKSVDIRNPHAIRPWQHVLEPLSGYLMLAEGLCHCGKKYASAWNFGPNDSDAKSVQVIVEKMISLWGVNANWRRDLNDNPHEANYLKLDIAKAKTQLGWMPRWNLETALEMIIDWHKAWMYQSDTRVICEQQIASYESALQH